MASSDLTEENLNSSIETAIDNINFSSYLQDDGEFEDGENRCDRCTSQDRKLGTVRRPCDGGISYKKISTSQIIESVRLGIQGSVSSMTSEPERDVLMEDFMTVESTPYTSLTSAGRQMEFVFKTYAPIAFRHLRDLFGIMPDHFLKSFSKSPLLEFKNAGSSGSDFYVTQDDNFIIKTVQDKEADFLQKLLPGYFLNLSQNPYTLLPKFCGLYCYKRNVTVRMVVMNNVLPSDVTIHQKYDLKGSTYMRKASKMELKTDLPTYKDLDFIENHPDGIYLTADVYKDFVTTIQRDCRVLESFRIMDYSLLLGVHYIENNHECDKEKLLKQDQNQVSPNGDGPNIPCDVNNALLNGAEKDDTRIISEARAYNPTEDSRKICLQSDIKNKKFSALSAIPAKSSNGENLLLYVGIIDILQSYRLRKKAEHFFKSMIHSSDTISVHNPVFYARRFEDFLTQRVFKIISPSLPKSK